MKTLFIILSALFALNSFAQQFTLSESSLKKAERKAAAESKMYTKKGFTTKDKSDLKQSLLEFYKLAYAADENKVPKYIWGMGLKNAATEAEAYQAALTDATEELPGLMLNYFQMWNMASDATDEEKQLVQSAIEKAGSDIKMTCEDEPYEVNVVLIKNKGDNVQVHVRTLTEQYRLRSRVRENIKDQLKLSTDWNDEKMTQLLTFKR